MAHLCGLCLALRDDHGQLARVATNYDGLIISVLVEAQTPSTAGSRRTAGPCPLRAMRTAPVATGEGARLAATVSLVLASAKVRDHIADRDGLLGRRPVAAAARRVADRWDGAGTAAGAGIGFDTAVLLDAVGRQAGIEALAGPDTGLLTVTEPTETATAAAFAHTAVLAGRPENAAPLAEAGRLFGRLAHLLDAVEDLAADRAAGAWNPVAATGADRAEVRRLCDDAVHGVRLALADVRFTDSALAHALLVHELGRSVDRVFGTHGRGGHHHARRPAGEFPSHDPFTGVELGKAERRRVGSRPFGCAIWLGLCCTGQLCCRDPYRDPWTGEPRSGWCRDCDCDCDPGCCDVCQCCQCGGDGGCCGGCDCGGCDCGGCDCDCCGCDC